MLSVVVTFLGIGLLRVLAAKSVGLMLTMVVAGPGCQFLIRLPLAQPAVPAATPLSSTSRLIS